MTTHLFTLGQSVRITNGYHPSGDVFSIIALLPPDGGSPQYRVRNEAESFERMTTEINLEVVTETTASVSVASSQSPLSAIPRRRRAPVVV